ncbi:MAG: tRNA (N6-threonylcarbamoyladenosine(37)-N6)-methyltransferase TrmO [Clostridia bacterium]|nr:tRNA (N6-threonylcarbamoyladenosine(37)-N6)-methyltransferase TrmO [Clostridia bacterium]
MTDENGIRFEIVARIRTPFKEKFGIPRQSLQSGGMEGRIVFEKPFRKPEMIRGIESFSHLWLIWLFSEHLDRGYSPTVRPPRLGGNKRVGVFATRAPFRPSPVGLSAVRLIRTETTKEEGTVLIVSGADLLDGTPILDIKPYLPLSDCIPEATGGLEGAPAGDTLDVSCDEGLLKDFGPSLRELILGTLSQDPRPGYHSDPERVYGMTIGNAEVRFRVEGKKLTVLSAEKIGDEES